MANILVTGAAGFIGYHLIQALLKKGDQVVGIDNLNDYYDPQLKLDRLKALGFDSDQVKTLAAGQHLKLTIQNLQFQRLDLADRSGIEQLFAENLLPMQPGDVPITYADVDDLIADTGFKPATSIEEGIGKFVDWYRGYYK